MKNLSILAQGEGKYIRRLLDSAFFNEIDNLKIVGMVSSDPNAQVLTRARNLHVPTFVVEKKLFPNEASYGVALLNKLKDIDTDFVIVDGMLTVPACVAKHYAGRLLAVKLTPAGQAMEILVYYMDAKGGMAEMFADAVVELAEEDTQIGFTEKVYAAAELLVLDAVSTYCEE